MAAAAAAAIGVPAPTATAVGTPVAAAAPSRIITADLTISPFADIMRWAPDVQNPRSVGPEDVVAYFAMLQDVFGSVTESVMLPEGLQAMWAAAFFLKRFSGVRYMPELSSESGNGVCGAVEAIGAGAGRAGANQFIKLQPKVTADDLRLDAVNTLVMSEILTAEEKRNGLPPLSLHESIMSYTDAFLGVLEQGPPLPRGMPQIYYYKIADQVADGKLLPVVGFFPSDVPRELRAAIAAAEQRAAQSGAAPGAGGLTGDGRGMTFAGRYAMSYESLLRADAGSGAGAAPVLAPAVAFDMINGMSLRSLMYKLTAAADFSAVGQRLAHMFGHMSLFGQYGWVHNDLHLSNILYNKATDRLVLIDYGRTLLDPETLPADIRDFADRELLKIDMLLHAKHLRGVAEEGSGSGIAAAQANRYSEFMKNKAKTLALPVIRPQTLNLIPRAPADFKKYLYLYDVATVTLGLMARATVPHAPARTVAAEFAAAFAATGIAEIVGSNRKSLTILDFESFMLMLDSPVAAGIPEHMHVILLGLMWVSMVLTAIRDEDVASGEIEPLVYTVVGDASMIMTDMMQLSVSGYMFIGGFQFLMPCLNLRVIAMFPRVKKYIDRFFAEGSLVPLAPGAAAAMPGGAAFPGGAAAKSGGMLSAMSSRSVAPGPARSARAGLSAARIAPVPRVAPSAARVAPSAARVAPSAARVAPSAARVAPSAARVAPSALRSAARPARGVRVGRRMRPIAWAESARPERDDAADVSAMIDSRRATPTAWARKALAEYVSPLRGLPAVFSIGADGNVAPAKIAGGAAKKRGGAAAKRGGDGAAPGELMRRIRAMLDALPVGNAAKTARLIAELENTRPFVLGAKESRRSARS
jgi:hypothetical protein